jgi:hypothetical protein
MDQLQAHRMRQCFENGEQAIQMSMDQLRTRGEKRVECVEGVDEWSLGLVGVVELNAAE